MPETAENQEETRLILAREVGFGEVSICNCGAVTLALEGVQLRFSAQAYVRLVQMIGTSVPLRGAASSGDGLRTPEPDGSVA